MNCVPKPAMKAAVCCRTPAYGVRADEQDCRDAIAFIQPDRVLTVNIKVRYWPASRHCGKPGLKLQRLCSRQ